MLRAAAVLVAGILVFATILGTGTAHAATLATGDPRELREKTTDPRVRDFFNRLPRTS